MKPTTLAVRAGEHTRQNCPVWIDMAPGMLPENPVLKDADGMVISAQTLQDANPAICFILDHLAKGASRTFTVCGGERSTAPGVRLSKGADGKIDVEINGRYFASYHYASHWARPFLMPIIGPYGDPITRTPSPTCQDVDHPHHKSLWVAWGDVNGSDQWSEVEGHGRQVHQVFEVVAGGPVFGRIAALNYWMAKDGRKLLEERRLLTFYHLPETGRLVDLTVTFIATEGPVRFGDTKEGGIASIRVAPSMTANRDGTMINSYGGTQEAETWGKRAHWCDYVGPVNGKTVGIAILDSPGNFRYPTYWHIREYGLMTANPFGRSHFTGDHTRDGSHTIPKGATFTFRYRFYFHAGDTNQADVAGRFLDHVAPPTVEIK